PTNPRTARAHPRASSSRGREVDIRALNQDPRDLKRTRRECQGEILTSGTCQASCQTRQNSSANAQRQGSRATHLGGLEASQTSRDAKRRHSAVTRGSRKVLERSETSASTERTHQIKIPGPGGHIKVQEARRDVERDWKCEKDEDGVHIDGRGEGQTAATSAARRDSKRVETDSLAEYKSNQHGKRERTMTGVPEASKPSTQHPRQPTDHANPPRRRGRLKSRPKSVNTTRRTHQATKSHRGQIGLIGRDVHVVHGP
ncbi:hypothetical protein EV363DRAFT_1187872, partial [Boletus edulis]